MDELGVGLFYYTVIYIYIYILYTDIDALMLVLGLKYSLLMKFIANEIRILFSKVSSILRFLILILIFLLLF